MQSANRLPKKKKVKNAHKKKKKKEAQDAHFFSPFSPKLAFPFFLGPQLAFPSQKRP
jgi:hypothetical protein